MDLHLESSGVATLIRTDRLVLRPLERADLDDLVPLIADYAVSSMLTRVPHPYTMADAEGFYERREDLGYLWIIEMDGDLVGAVSIGVQLGYWLGKPFWGQGIMTDAAQAAVNAAFADQSLHEVRSSYFDGNPASGNVLRKLGFQDDGPCTLFSIARKANVAARKVSLTRQDWQARRG